MRHLLITGQGNFGSIHGLPPAAMRYTEAKLSPVAAEMLEDIKLDTVDFQPSYDEKYQEPRVLPAKFPNLLVNGSGGIAVGMATSIPPHNLGEVCDAVVAFIDNPRDRARRADGDHPRPRLPHRRHHLRPFGHPRGVPDRPGQGRSSAPSTRSRSRRTAARRSSSPRSPTSSPRSRCSRSWPSWSTRDRVTGVTDIVDESDRKQPVRIVVKVKKGEDPNVVLNQLFQFSPLQDSFSVIMLALVDGRPQDAAAEGDAPAVRRPPGQRDPPADAVPAPPGAGAGAHRRGPADRAGVHRRDHPGDPVVGQPGRGPGAADGDGGLRRDPPQRP